MNIFRIISKSLFENGGNFIYLIKGTSKKEAIDLFKKSGLNLNFFYMTKHKSSVSWLRSNTIYVWDSKNSFYIPKI